VGKIYKILYNEIYKPPKKHISMKNRIKLSIIIPVAPWRDPEIIKHIEKQSYPKNHFEILIIKGTNVPINRNEGIKKAKGDIIVFLDDDGIIQSNYFSKINDFLKKYPKIDVISGPQLTPSNQKFFGRISGLVFENIFGCPKINKRYKKAKLNLNANSDMVSGANLIIKKRVLKKVLFDTKIYPGDDVNFIDRIKEKGFKFAYNPEIIIFHKRREKLKEFLFQIYQYGRARSQNKKYPLQEIFDKPLFIVPFFFFIYLLIFPFLSIFSPIFIFPLIIYFLLSIIAAFYESIKHRSITTFILLPFLFFLTHLSYGMGYFMGTINKKISYDENKWRKIK
jgi:succinoglycan biosynthesis protein ExoA